jgi:hypothetical protein
MGNIGWRSLGTTLVFFAGLGICGGPLYLVYFHMHFQARPHTHTHRQTFTHKHTHTPLCYADTSQALSWTQIPKHTGMFRWVYYKSGVQTLKQTDSCETQSRFSQSALSTFCSYNTCDSYDTCDSQIHKYPNARYSRLIKQVSTKRKTHL